MSDERISSTPMTPRCPASEGKIPAANPILVPDLRQPPEDWYQGYDNPVCGGIGILCLLVIALSTFSEPKILALFAVLLVPTAIRTMRLAFRPAVDEARSLCLYFSAAFISSFGVSTLAGMASVIAFFCIFFPIAIGANSAGSEFAGAVFGLIAAFVVFVAIFMGLWPRDRPGEEGQRPPDPEN